MKDSQVNELLYQALETELGGVQVYRKAIECAVNEDLNTEWSGYLAETEEHVRIVEGVFDALDLDKSTRTAGR
jgi:rubrerythrin